MSRKKGLIVIVLALVMATMAAVPATAGRGMRSGAMGGGMRGRPAMGQGAMPAFTEAQQEKMQDIRSGFDEERVEISNRIKVMHLEMRELMTGDKPDFGKLERMIDDISVQRAEMMKIRIRQHVAVRKILTDDQKVLFDQGFGMQMGHFGMGGRPGGGMGGPGAMGSRPGGGMMGGRGRMMCVPGGAVPPQAVPGRMGI